MPDGAFGRSRRGRWLAVVCVDRDKMTILREGGQVKTRFEKSEHAFFFNFIKKQKISQTISTSQATKKKTRYQAS